MLTLLIARMGEAFADPRASARRILAANPTPGEAVTMVLLSVCLIACAEVILSLLMGQPEPVADAANGPPVDPGPDPANRPITLVEQIVLTFVLSLAQFFVFASLAWFVGRQAGGHANRNQVLAVVGWHDLAISPAKIVIVVAPALVGSGGAPMMSLVFLAAIIYSLYMFAAFIGEAHGFARTGPIMVAAIGVLFGLSMFLVLLAMMLGVNVQG